MENHAIENAKCWYESICEAIGSGEDALNDLAESVLDVCYRSAWESARGDLTPAEFYILLTTGGPALRIRGEIDQYGSPCNCIMEWQDWGTPWTEYLDADKDVLRQFADRLVYAVF